MKSVVVNLLLTLLNLIIAAFCLSANYRMMQVIAELTAVFVEK